MINQHLKHYQIKQNPHSNVLLVFLQGWPDSKQMWEEKMNSKEQLKQFKHIYINFPNYGDEKISWGQDFKTIAERTKKTIDLVKNVERKILVCHDWGCVFGYVLDQMYPKYFDHIVAMDVPAYTEVSGGIKGKLFVITYQSLLIWLFFIGGSIGGGLTKFMSRLFKHQPTYIDQIKSQRNYPYYYYWKNQIASRFGKEQRLLKGYIPSVPISYFFGKNKPMQFHGQRWIDFIKKTEGCSIQGFQAGHWFMGKFKIPQIKQIIRVAKL